MVPQPNGFERPRSWGVKACAVAAMFALGAEAGAQGVLERSHRSLEFIRHHTRYDGQFAIMIAFAVFLLGLAARKWVFLPRGGRRSWSGMRLPRRRDGAAMNEMVRAVERAGLARQQGEDPKRFLERAAEWKPDLAELKGVLAAYERAQAEKRRMSARDRARLAVLRRRLTLPRPRKRLERIP